MKRLTKEQAMDIANALISAVEGMGSHEFKALHEAHPPKPPLIIRMPEISQATAKHMARLLELDPRRIVSRPEDLRGVPRDIECHLFWGRRGYDIFDSRRRDIHDELEARGFTNVTQWEADHVVLYGQRR